ncbi:WD40 repeat-like protein [Myriangium duriaei CBS 260.36]|uniref:WD40 repeat-like protein n=1 Tax=Myriangium duriaei CBS 260.36 TaxID=1168546 RepID=A0A9P4J851_9PEZI|nr:WD40 repeat-like protein [Myriangium duriaei CBS 260.36]
MATVLPPPSKRQRTQAAQRARDQVSPEQIPDGLQRIQFRDADSGQAQGSVVTLSLSDLTPQNLSLLLNSLLGRNEAHDRLPYRFYNPLGDGDFSQSDIIAAHAAGQSSTEVVLDIPCRAEAVFKVRAVTRCSAAISGHGDSILSAQFSPVTSTRLATGSGDNMARIWDTETGTPLHTLKGHAGWVLAVAWSPDGARLATGGNDGMLRLWNPVSGASDGQPLKGHTQRVNSLSWEPFHLQEQGRPRIASASKDGTVRVWDVVGKKCDMALSGHKGNISCVRWGGAGQIYTASHDKTIKVWNASTGSLQHTLSSHAHWVNHLALSTDFALRTAYYDHTGKAGIPATDSECVTKAQKRFAAAASVNGKSGISERVISASDDCTIFLWAPAESAKPIARLHGHQKQVNHVVFSPDGTLIASAAFDNHVKLWTAKDGAFLYTLKGHVGPVYQVAFSADSRLLVSASKDTTVKVWEVRTGKLVEDLPGHKDQVFAVDWSPDGKRVGSAGRDKQVRIWTH